MLNMSIATVIFYWSKIWAKHSRRLTGMGLKTHSGDIQLETKEGKGTR
jgi:hypothetical protein